MNLRKVRHHISRCQVRSGWQAQSRRSAYNTDDDADEFVSYSVSSVVFTVVGSFLVEIFKYNKNYNLLNTTNSS